MAFVSKNSNRRAGGSKRAANSWRPTLRAAVAGRKLADSEELMANFGPSDDLDVPPGLYQEADASDCWDVPPGLCQFANTAFHEASESSCSTEASSSGVCTPPRSLSSVAEADVPPGLMYEHAPVQSAAAAPLMPPGVFDLSAAPSAAAAAATTACPMPHATCGQPDLQASSWASSSYDQVLTQLSLPGPAGVGAPPGLEDVALRKVGTTSFHVMISGLPRNLLTEASVEVMLEQAALAAGFGASKMTGFTVQTSCSSSSSRSARSDDCREVVVGFSSSEAAELCCAHFHGMRWGTTVAACTVLPAEIMEEEQMCVEGVSTDLVESPMCRSSMSKDAPMFVPSAWSHALTVSKEASTDAGDSELSDATIDDIDLSPFSCGGQAAMPMMVY